MRSVCWLLNGRILRKMRRLFKIHIFSCLFLLVISSSWAEEKLLSRQDALAIAEGTPEAEAFYGLQDGYLMNCIEKSVVKPCDSKWVTCIEDAWVVKFTLGEVCGIKHDERLSLTFVVDSKTGKIISRFPELPYFKIPNYCHDTYDCLSAPKGEMCLNFIYGQLDKEVYVPSKQCLCQENVCVQYKEIISK